MIFPFAQDSSRGLLVAQLVLVKAYCQVNTLKGHRYLDDAGKIMNLYDDTFTEKSVGLDGLHMVHKGATLEGLRVTIDRIWLAFAKPDTLQYVFDNASKLTNQVAEIINVTEAERFGLRLEHLYPIEDTVTARAMAAGIFREALLPEDMQLSTFEAVVEAHGDDLNVILRVRPVRRSAEPEEAKALLEFGIMFDADIYRRGKPLLISDLRKFYRAAEGWVKSSLPSLVEHVTSEVHNA